MKHQKEGSLLLGLIALLTVVVIVAVVGVLALRPEKTLIQGEAEAAEYRVSGKVPGRIEMYLYEEGEQVKKGDTLVVIYSPEVEAKKAQALAAREMAEAVNQKAKNGAQREQIQGAYELYQKAKAGEEIYRKSYDRVQRLYDKGVVSAQKRDEVEAQYKAAVATVKAARSQYEMALSGAREEDAGQSLFDNRAVLVSSIKQFRMQQHRADNDGGTKVGGPVEKSDSGITGHILRLIKTEETHLRITLQRSGKSG